MITSILIDIEGTTGSAGFVHDVLFPYSIKMMPDFIQQHQHDSEVAALIHEVRHLAQIDHDLQTVIAQLICWIEHDQKVPALKALQGMVWRQGYEEGDFQSHIYPDAYHQLNAWHHAGYALYVFSSGSVQAQQLFFKHSCYGDLRHVFRGFFDTQTGAKQASAAYRTIIDNTGIAGDRWLFLSDSVAELDAAKLTGMQTGWVQRDMQIPLGESDHLLLRSFDDVILDS